MIALRGTIGLLLVLPFGFLPTRGEVSVRAAAQECRGAMITMTIVEEPDPVGYEGSAWSAYSDERIVEVVNADGEPRRDLFPDLLFHGDECVAQLIWSYRRELDNYDIAFTEVVRGSVRPLRFIAETGAAELDPRLFQAEDGSLYATWWTRVGDQGEVWLSQRRPGKTAWAEAIRVTAPGESARRPSVAVVDGQVLVAYEFDPQLARPSREVVIVTLDRRGVASREIVAKTMYTGRISPVVHTRHGLVWIDWAARDDKFSYAVLKGGNWSRPESRHLDDAGWVGREEVRLDIQRELLSGE